MIVAEQKDYINKKVAGYTSIDAAQYQGNGEIVKILKEVLSKQEANEL